MCEHTFVPYVELHCHSAFSFLDGASLPEELVVAALERGHQALALTDHNSVSGSMEFAQAASSLGLRAIHGAEVDLVDPVVVDAEGMARVRHSEQVFPTVVAERAAVLAGLGRATSAAMLVPVADGTDLTAVLHRVISGLGAAAVDTTDSAGRRHQLWLLGPGPDQDELIAVAGRHPLLVADGIIVTELGGQGKRRLHAKHPQQPGNDTGQAPLRYRDPVGHERADQQYRQIKQCQIGGACDREWSRLAKLAGDPAQRTRCTQPTQKRKQPRSI